MSLKTPRQPAFKAMAMVVLFVIALPACSGASIHPVYSRSMVEPISVQKKSVTELVLRYKVRPESSHYSGGVDYERVGDTLRVVIGRCAVGAPCEPMAKSVIPLDDTWQAEVHLPYDGSRVVVVHSDGEKQVYP